MATIKLTEKALAALPAPPAGVAQTYYWDEQLIGFGVVVGTSCKTFVARAWVGRKKRRVKVGIAGRMRDDGHPWTVTLARKRAQELLGEMAAGVDPNAVQRASRGGPTLRDGLELHLSNMRQGRNRRQKACSPRSIATIEKEIPRHLGTWMDRPLVELTGQELKAVCDRIAAAATRRTGSNPENSPGVALTNRLLAQVSAIWESTDRLHDLPGKNPAKRIGQAALKPRDERVPDDGFAGWYAKVQALENPVRRDLQLVVLFTGLRSESVRSLRWDDVDTERRLLHVRKAKGDKPYTTPLAQTCLDIVERRRKENAKDPWIAQLGGDQGWIFPTLSRDQKRVIHVAEPKEWRVDSSGKRTQYLPGLHALRRTYNSVAIEIGIEKEARLALMNHEGQGVNAKHYAAPETWGHLAECQAKIEAALWQRIRARKLVRA